MVIYIDTCYQVSFVFEKSRVFYLPPVCFVLLTHLFSSLSFVEFCVTEIVAYVLLTKVFVGN